MVFKQGIVSCLDKLYLHCGYCLNEKQVVKNILILVCNYTSVIWTPHCRTSQTVSKQFLGGEKNLFELLMQ